jgi:hypothetical protein
MELHGIVQNGVIVFDNPQPLPEGAKVKVLVAEPPRPTPGVRPPPGLGKGMITFIAPDFDAPLEDLKEYME